MKNVLGATHSLALQCPSDHTSILFEVKDHEVLADDVFFHIRVFITMPPVVAVKSLVDQVKNKHGGVEDPRMRISVSSY